MQGGLFARKVGGKPEAKAEPWFVDKLVAGTRTRYGRGLTFTTIADAGHMCAGTKPKQVARALDLFIQDKDLTDSK